MRTPIWQTLSTAAVAELKSVLGRQLVAAPRRWPTPKVIPAVTTAAMSCLIVVQATPRPVNAPRTAPNAVAATAPMQIEMTTALSPPKNSHGRSGRNAPIANNKDDAMLACQADPVDWGAIPSSRRA